MPLPPGSRAIARLAVSLLVLLTGIGALAATTLERGATATRPAVRVQPPVRDVAVAFDLGAVDPEVVDGVARAVATVGGQSARSRSASVGLIRVVRDGATIHAPPAGYLIPMGVVALPHDAVTGVVGADVAAVLDRNSVAMNELTAATIGARAGDVVEMRGAYGATVPLVVASIEPYAQVGFAELVFDIEVADRLGVTRDTRVVMWGFTDRAGLDEALAAHGVLGRVNTKVNRSWDPADPDDSISTPRIKAKVGEPWYRINADGSLSMHPDWVAGNLTDGRVVLNDTVRVRAQCHVAIVDDLRAALADVVAAGLAGEIDVGNTNTYGGCYNPRYSRTSGYLSRHAYAVAIDMNTVTNCLGCVPRLHCDVVRIFRRHGFVWGGNFRVSDGMHFEWVGERRDQIEFASRYCPNIVSGTSGTGGTTDDAMLGNSVLTVNDPMPIVTGDGGFGLTEDEHATLHHHDH